MVVTADTDRFAVAVAARARGHLRVDRDRAEVAAELDTESVGLDEVGVLVEQGEAVVAAHPADEMVEHLPAREAGILDVRLAAPLAGQLVEQPALRQRQPQLLAQRKRALNPAQTDDRAEAEHPDRERQLQQQRTLDLQTPARVHPG